MRKTRKVAGGLALCAALLLPLFAASGAFAAERVSIEVAGSGARVEGTLIGMTEEGFLVNQGGGRLRSVPFARVRRLERESEHEKQRANVLTFDVRALLGQYASLGYERRLHDRLSIRVEGGYGFAKIAETIPSSYRLWGAGGQARLFVAGGFQHGIFLAAEGSYSRFLREEREGIPTARWHREEILAGGLLGYRHIFPFGLVLDGSLGFGRDMGTVKSWVTLLHLDVGGAL